MSESVLRAIENPPGLGTIEYRSGDRKTYLSALLARLTDGDLQSLSALTAREPGDFTLALADAWSTVADVLTFYNERIANESYLLTAREERSLRWLGRLVGYEPRPGLAATTYLTFTLDETPSSPRRVLIPRGTQVQSIPQERVPQEGGEMPLPQPYETLSDLVTRPEWNLVRPRLTKEQDITSESRAAWFKLQGGVGNIKPGDMLLFKMEHRWAVARVSEAAPFAGQGQIQVKWTQLILSQNGFPEHTREIYFLRQRAAIFGHNAADWRSLPDQAKATYLGAPDVTKLSRSELYEWPQYVIPAPLFPQTGKWRMAHFPPTTQSVADAALRAADSVFRHALMNMVIAVGDAIMKVMKAVTELLKAASDLSGTLIGMPATMLVDATNAAEGVKESLKQLLSKFVPEGKDWDGDIGQDVENIISIVTHVPSDLLTANTEGLLLLNQISASLTSLLNVPLNALAKIGKQLEGLVNPITDALNAVNNVPEKISEFIGALFVSQVVHLSVKVMMEAPIPFDRSPNFIAFTALFAGRLSLAATEIPIDALNSPLNAARTTIGDAIQYFSDHPEAVINPPRETPIQIINRISLTVKETVTTPNTTLEKIQELLITQSGQAGDSQNFDRMFSQSLLGTSDFQSLKDTAKSTVSDIAALEPQSEIKETRVAAEVIGIVTPLITPILMIESYVAWESFPCPKDFGLPDWMPPFSPLMSCGLLDGAKNAEKTIREAVIKALECDAQVRRALPDLSRDQIDLDNLYPNIGPDSWAVLLLPEKAGKAQAMDLYQIDAISEAARNDFNLNSRVTRLKLKEAKFILVDAVDPTDKCKAIPSSGALASQTESAFIRQVRNTTVFAQSEALVLMQEPDDTEVSGNLIPLNQAIPAAELSVGRPVIVKGELVRDYQGMPKGSPHTELAFIESYHSPANILVLKGKGLLYGYQRTSTSIYLNVSAASHGLTRRETLGSGNASQAGQIFTLRGKPLTYLPAGGPGFASTLEVRVNNLAWHAASNPLETTPGEHAYLLHTADDGTVTLQFGDGEHGSRLPSGVENVTAVYRTGVGRQGNADPGRITLLNSPPPGVRQVNNLVPAAHGAEARSLTDSRLQIAGPAQTMLRVVSLDDYALFALNQPDVGKALATWAWGPQGRVIFLTLAGQDGALLNAVRRKTIKENLRNVGDPLVALEVQNFSSASFWIAGKLIVDKATPPDLVLAAVKNALRRKFDFTVRQFGQPVTLLEVTSAIQAVPGVVAVDVDALQRVENKRLVAFNTVQLGQPASPMNALPIFIPGDVQARLVARYPQVGSSGALLPAELLLLDSIDLKIKE